MTHRQDPEGGGGGCARRVQVPAADARLIAPDAETGERCTTVADDGAPALEAGMPSNPAGHSSSTSPPVAVDGATIIGDAVTDTVSICSRSRVVRAFDIDTGDLVRTWDSGDPDRTKPIDIAGGETCTAHSPDIWSVSSVDEGRGLVCIPLGNRVPDQQGMARSPAVEEHSSSVVVLDVATGARERVFQTVHHHLWDMDVPAQPVLVDLTRPDGSDAPARVQPTKRGGIHVPDRRTGTPLPDVTGAPPRRAPSPRMSPPPTQPVSALTFMPDPPRGRDMWGITLSDRPACRNRFRRLNCEGRCTRRRSTDPSCIRAIPGCSTGARPRWTRCGR